MHIWRTLSIFYALEVVRAHADGSYSRFAADPVEVAPAADSLCFEVTHDHASRLSNSFACLIDNKLIMRPFDGKPLFCQPSRVIDFPSRALISPIWPMKEPCAHLGRFDHLEGGIYLHNG